MNFTTFKLISKLFSGIFLFLIGSLFFFFLIISFKPIKVNFLELNIHDKFFSDLKVKSLGDIYFSYNKFSNNFEFLFENIETQNSFIPNLLVGIDLKKTLLLEFKPSILKIYDAKIKINIEDENKNFNLESFSKEIVNDLIIDTEKKFLSKNFFEIIEINNSSLEIISKSLFDENILFFPVDIKIEKFNNLLKLSAFFQQSNKENFLTVKIEEINSTYKINANFENFRIGLTKRYTDNLSIGINDLFISGGLNIILTNKFDLMNLNSNLSFNAEFSNYSQTAGLNSFSFIERGNIITTTDMSSDLISFSIDFTEKNSDFSIDYTINKKSFLKNKLLIQIDEIELSELIKFWPSEFKKTALDWVKNNAQGLLSSFIMDFDFKTFDMTTNFNFNKTIIKYSDNMPRIFDISGNANFTNDELNFNIFEGNSKEIKILNAAVKIFDLDQPVEQAKIYISLDSDTENILEYLRNSNLDTSNFQRIRKLSGIPDFKLELNFPLLLDLKIEEISYKAELSFNNTNINDFFKNYNLESLDLNIKIDSESVSFTGNGLYDFMPISFSGKEFLNEKNTESIEINIDLRPDFFNEFYDGLITNSNGNIPLVMNIENRKYSGELEIFGTAVLNDFSADLEALSLNHNYSHGKFKFSYFSEVLQESKINFKFNSEDIDISALVINKFEKQEITIEKFKSSTQDFNGKIVFDKNVGDINIFGKKLNFSNFLKNQRKNYFLNITFNFDVENFFLSEIPIITPYLKGKIVNNKFENLLFSFKNDNLKHLISIDHKENKKYFLLESQDASYFLDIFGMNPNINKGDLKINAIKTNDKSFYSGEIILNNFIAYDTPFFAKVLTLFSLDGLEQKLTDGGIFFDNLKSEYTFNNDNTNFSSGLIRGSDLGLSFDGDLDIDTKNFDINGTLIPAYTLNTLLTSLPLLGDIITAGSPEEGILAATFNIKKVNEEIDFNFNPISVLVPSIIRNFLDF